MRQSLTDFLNKGRRSIGPKKLFLLGALWGLFLSNIGCSVKIRYSLPEDEVGQVCGTKIGSTPIHCVNQKTIASGIISGSDYICRERVVFEGENSPTDLGFVGSTYRSEMPVDASCVYQPPVGIAKEESDALIIVSEAGYFEENTVQSAALAASSYPDDLKPYFRTLQGNAILAMLQKIFTSSPRRYGRVYHVRSDAETKSLFLGAIKLVTAHHNKVDLLMLVHGSVGQIHLSPDLQTSLTAGELIKFTHNQMDLESRNKVRAIFNTACQSAEKSWRNPVSFARGLSLAFPASISYETIGVNYAAVHRDLVAFESFYQGNDFGTALMSGNQAVNYNLANGQVRDFLPNPAIIGRGCVELLFTRHCRTETILTGGLHFESWMRLSSTGRLVMGPQAKSYQTIGLYKGPQFLRAEPIHEVALPESRMPAASATHQLEF